MNCFNCENEWLTWIQMPCFRKVQILLENVSDLISSLKLILPKSFDIIVSMFDTTIRKQTQIRNELSNKQPQVKTNRISFYAEIIKDITTMYHLPWMWLLFDLASSGRSSERNVGNNRMDDTLLSKCKHYNLKHNQD